MWYLLGDMGGTNLRLAAADRSGAITTRRNLPTGGGTRLPDACAALVAEMGSPPAAVAFAVAGVVDAGRVTFTNAAQTTSVDALARACETPTARVFLLNDFEAAAWSLAPSVLEQITYFQRGEDAEPSGPRVIIGPGTGLGVGALIRQGGRPLAVPGEGGHMRLSPQSTDEVAYFEALIAAWPEVQMGAGLAVEAEAILSGTGLPKWYRAIAAVQGAPAPLDTAESIFEAARHRRDAHAARAVATFARYLGGMAGDLGLIFGARGGVFLTGGVAQSNPWMFDADFLAAFNGGGRHSAWRRAMPLGLCIDPDFGLNGAHNYLLAALD